MTRHTHFPNGVEIPEDLRGPDEYYCDECGHRGFASTFRVRLHSSLEDGMSPAEWIGRPNDLRCPKDCEEGGVKAVPLPLPPGPPSHPFSEA